MLGTPAPIAIRAAVLVTSLVALPCLAQQPGPPRPAPPCPEPDPQDGAGPSTRPVPSYETVVSARRRPRRVLSCSVQTTGSEQIRRRHARTLAEVLEGEPGISFEADGPANARIGIRGLSRERVGLLLDGSPQLLVRNAGTDILVDPWDVERIEVIKGASALARAPGVVGGLVDVVLRRPALPERGWAAGLEASSGFSSVNSSYRGAVRAHVAGHGGLYVQASGTASYATRDTRAGEGVELPNTDYRLFTGGLIGGYRSRDLLVEATYYGRFGLPVGTYRSKLYQDPDIRHMAAAKLRAERIGPLRTSEVRLSVMRFDVDFRQLGQDLRTTRAWLVGEWTSLALEAWSNLDLVERHDMFAGVNFYWAPTHRWQGTADRQQIGEVFPRAERLSAGLVIQDNVRINDWLRVSGVVRLDVDRLSHGPRGFVAGSGFEQAIRLDRVRQRERTYLAVSGNLGAYLLPLPALTLRLNVGTAARPPVPGKFSVFIPASATAAGRVGNADIAAERTLDLELGGRLAAASTSIDAVGYFTAVFDYMAEYTSRTLRDPLAPASRYRTFGNQHALLRGVELGLRQALWGQRLVARGALSYAVGSFTAPVADSVSTDTDLPLVPPLRGFVALESRPIPGLHVALRARFAAAQHRNSELAGEAATPMYGVLDLCAEYTLRRLWSPDRATLYLNVLNMTDARYREHTVQYTGVALGFEHAYLQPGVDVRAGVAVAL